MSRIPGATTVVFVIGLAGCAAARIEGTPQPLAGGAQGLTLELSNFVFRPNVITVDAGQRITVSAVSRSIAPHNVTIVSPEGETVADIDVPRRQTRIFDVTLARSGKYQVYCDLFLHRALGMEGVVVAR